ncbi:amidohydrolase family protein [Actinomycetota bacterium]
MQAVPVVLRPEWLIDGVAPDPVENHEVWTQGRDIVYVGPVGRPAPSDASISTMPGMTLLPGLIDCHVHYLFDSEVERGNSVELAPSTPVGEAVLVGARNARRALAAGITTARSAGAPGDLDVVLSQAIDRGDIPGPRLLASGRAITITGGHGTPFGITADDPTESIRAVRTLVAAGARVIKAVASEAAMLTSDRAGVPELSAAQLTAIVAEAARLGISVMAHAQDSASVRAAAAAGVASVEHAFLADEASLAAVAESGVTLTPTLVVTDVYRSLDNLSVEQRARQEAVAAAHRASCQKAIELGIPIIAGTDCGLRGVHPDLLWREMVLLEDHGLPPMDAIRAATSLAARVLGLSGEIGSIQADKRADLVAVRGRPLEDIQVLARPVFVMRHGDIVMDRRS